MFGRYTYVNASTGKFCKMGNHTHTMATLNPLHCFYFCWIKLCGRNCCQWRILLSLITIFANIPTYTVSVARQQYWVWHKFVLLIGLQRNQRIVKPWWEKLDFGMLLYAKKCPVSVSFLKISLSFGVQIWNPRGSCRTKRPLPQAPQPRLA